MQIDAKASVGWVKVEANGSKFGLGCAVGSKVKGGQHASEGPLGVP